LQRIGGCTMSKAARERDLAEIDSIHRLQPVAIAAKTRDPPVNASWGQPRFLIGPD
jgi:hypothetical protein